MMQKRRRFCFTINNPADQQYATLDEVVERARRDIDKPARDREGRVRFIIGQAEKGEGTGTEHIQGYIELYGPMTGNNLKKNILKCNHAHIEPAKGTAQQNRVYCTKSETALYLENGEKKWAKFGGNPTQQGKKQTGTLDSHEQVILMINNGATIEEVLEDNPVTALKDHDKIVAHYVRNLGTRKTDPKDFKIEILYGPSGCGKSYTAFDKYPRAYNIPAPGSQWWFPDYRGEKICLLNEFKGSGVKPSQLLQLLDIWPWTIQYKGGNMQFHGEHIVFTTTLHPSRWYPGVPPGKKEELKRRFREFGKLITFEPMDTTVAFPAGIKFAEQDMKDFEWEEPETQNFATTAAGVHNQQPWGTTGWEN